MKGTKREGEIESREGRMEGQKKERNRRGCSKRIKNEIKCSHEDI